MAQDQKQAKAVTKHFTREQLEAMSVEELDDLLGNLPAGATFHGKAVVRRADGSIKYDDPEMEGQYNEL